MHALMIQCRAALAAMVGFAGVLFASVSFAAPPVSASCFLSSEYLGEAYKSRGTPEQAGADEPGATAFPSPRAQWNPDSRLNAGNCLGNTNFYMGAALHDVTGVAGAQAMMGYESESQLTQGIHTRLYARAFAFEAPCNGKRLIFLTLDHGMVFGATRNEVLRRIAEDPELGRFYGPDNVMMSATHTHGAPGGHSHHEAYNFFKVGYDEDTWATIVEGMFQAIRKAHLNLTGSKSARSPGEILVAYDELLDANLQRSRPAYDANPQSERERYNINQETREADDAAEEALWEADTNKLMFTLRLQRPEGQSGSSAQPRQKAKPRCKGCKVERSPLAQGGRPACKGCKVESAPALNSFGNLRDLGLISWFSVHPTSTGNTNRFITGDNKGFAALMFERIFGADYNADETFVASFAQGDEGDTSPNVHILGDGVEFPQRGGGADEYESNAISGIKQLAKALELYQRAGDNRELLTGGIDYRLVHLQMDDQEVTDPVIKAMQPPEGDALHANPMRTCRAAFGVSMGAGAEDGPAFTKEGVACPADGSPLSEDLLTTLQGDFATGQNGKIPPDSLSNVALCPASARPGYECHAEKPVLLPLGTDSPYLAAGGPAKLTPDVLPFQIFTLGNLAIVGLPFEVSTMAGRRIQDLLTAEFASSNIDYVVIAGLANEYSSYLTTREEYSVQHYEGASTQFGPWSHAVTMQALRALSLSLKDGVAAPSGVEFPQTAPGTRKAPPYTPADFAADGAFGDVIVDVAGESFASGDTVQASFRSGHPRNDQKIGGSYLFVEKQLASDQWEVVFTDRDPETFYRWEAETTEPGLSALPAAASQSTSTLIWNIPDNAPSGTYRLRHVGVAQQSESAPAQPYTGISSPFDVQGAGNACPGNHWSPPEEFAPPP